MTSGRLSISSICFDFLPIYFYFLPFSSLLFFFLRPLEGVFLLFLCSTMFERGPAAKPQGFHRTLDGAQPGCACLFNLIAGPAANAGLLPISIVDCGAAAALPLSLLLYRILSNYIDHPFSSFTEFVKHSVSTFVEICRTIFLVFPYQTCDNEIDRKLQFSTQHSCSTLRFTFLPSSFTLLMEFR